jgi:hypothetical protein
LKELGLSLEQVARLLARDTSTIPGGTQLAQRGARLRTIQKILGHESVEMALVYIGLTDEDVRQDYQNVLGPGALIAGLGAKVVLEGLLTEAEIRWIKDHYFQTKLELGRLFIRKQVADHQRRFFIFVGGGLVARQYRDAGRAIVGHELPDEDLDWLGIHATRLNAHLLRTMFRDLAHPVIIKDYSIIQKPEKPVVIAAGWKPGWSTDYPAVILAQDYQVKAIFKLSNTDYIYDKDPRMHQDARPFEHLSCLAARVRKSRGTIVCLLAAAEWFWSANVFIWFGVQR